MNTLKVCHRDRIRTTRIYLIACAVVLALMALGLTHAWQASASEISPLPDVVEADGSLGTCYSFYEINDAPLSSEAYAAGSRWDRFDFRWNVIESRQGTFEFAPHEALVDQDRADGLEVVAILGSTAEWAVGDCPAPSQPSLKVPLPAGHPPLPHSTDDDVWWRPCPPVNLDLPWDHPDNYWGRYVYQTVSHFKGKVNVWEMWNEPDLSWFWSGSAAEYARLLEVGYRAAKAADPGATVLFAGLAYWTQPSFYIDVLHALGKAEGTEAHNGFFDVLSLHLYSNVYTLGPIADEIQNVMQATVGTHPIWLTETGVPIWDETRSTPYDNAATAEEAAAFMIEGFAEARAAGIDRFFVFRTHDESMSEAFGLIRNDRSLRPGYVAYQVAARYLQGENQISGPFSDGDVRRITFWGTPRGRIDVLWKETGGTPTTYLRSAVVPTATLVDHRGQTEILTAQADGYSVPLQPATADTGASGTYIIGGPPLLLIQSDSEIPESALRPMPAASPSTWITLTWDVTDTMSGYWYAQIDRAPAPDGPWERIADWGDTLNLTTTRTYGGNYRTWYFRVRSRDNVGNWEPWSATSQISTSINIPPTVTVSVDLFLDENSNNVWDDEETRPETLPKLRWLDSDDIITGETIGSSWHLTQTVAPGSHTIETHLSGYLLDRTTFLVETLPLTQSVALTVGLKPIRAQVFMPLTLRSSDR